MKRVLLALLIGSAAAGCTSPEAKRSRGGGPGADPQNRPATIRVHEGSRQFWETPLRISVQHPPLDGALQAQQTALR